MLKISIVTISYNQGQFLEKCIKSILNQNYSNLEYIIVDPGSTDGSREIIEKYRPHFSKIILDPDKGPADGLNKGFSQATGEIYGFINADDMLMPGALQRINDFFEKHADVDVMSGHGYIIDENDNILHSMYSCQLSGSAFHIRGFVNTISVIVQQSTFFTKDLFQKVGGFDISYKAIWDGALFVDFMLQDAKFKVIHKYLSMFRVYSQSLTGSGVGPGSNAPGSKYYDMMAIRSKQPIRKGVEFLVLKGMTWMTNPLVAVLRIIDGIRNPKRYV